MYVDDDNILTSDKLTVRKNYCNSKFILTELPDYYGILKNNFEVDISRNTVKLVLNDAPMKQKSVFKT